MKNLNTDELQELCKQYIDETQNNPNEHSIVNQFTIMDFVLWLKDKNIEFNKKDKITISDPNNLLSHKSMNLYSKKGHKVIVTKQTINWGMAHDKEQANQFLEIDKKYTIESIDVGDWSSKVVLQELPNQRFNTVHFIDVKE